MPCQDAYDRALQARLRIQPQHPCRPRDPTRRTTRSPRATRSAAAVHRKAARSRLRRPPTSHRGIALRRRQGADLSGPAVDVLEQVPVDSLQPLQSVALDVQRGAPGFQLIHPPRSQEVLSGLQFGRVGGPKLVEENAVLIPVAAGHRLEREQASAHGPRPRLDEPLHRLVHGHVGQELLARLLRRHPATRPARIAALMALSCSLGAMPSSEEDAKNYDPERGLGPNPKWRHGCAAGGMNRPRPRAAAVRVATARALHRCTAPPHRRSRLRQLIQHRVCPSPRVLFSTPMPSCTRTFMRL